MKMDYSKQGKRNKRKGWEGENFVVKYLKKTGWDWAQRISGQRREVGKTPDVLAVMLYSTMKQIYSGELIPNYRVKAFEVKNRKNWRENPEETKDLLIWAKEHKIEVWYAIVEVVKHKRIVKFLPLKVKKDGKDN